MYEKKSLNGNRCQEICRKLIEYHIIHGEVWMWKRCRGFENDVENGLHKRQFLMVFDYKVG